MLAGLALAAEYFFLFGPTPAVIELAQRALIATTLVFVLLVIWNNIGAERLYRSLTAGSKDAAQS
jgi:hypothetical protein